MAGEQPVWERNQLTGNWGGARTLLAEQGVEVGIAYIGENFSLLSGGLKRGTSFEGRLDVSLDTDLHRLVGWAGATTHIRAFQIHSARGGNIANFAGGLSDPSNIDALPATRLFTAWFQQAYGSYGSLRIGQLAADDEFLTSTTANGLINATFGWPNAPSANLPSGGPAYPLATPGVRLQLNLSENVSLLGAVFSGDPAGKGCHTFPAPHPQDCNRYGTTFSFTGGAFLIGEAQYHFHQGKASTGLAGSYKLGGWYHTHEHADQHFGVDATGAIVTLAKTPAKALMHRGNWGIYGVADQMVWRGAQTSVSLFARAAFMPSNRNLVSMYVDGGIGVKGLLPGRADDVLTFGVAHTHISDDAKALDREIMPVAGIRPLVRQSETVFELSYILQLTPAWTLQPDIQYIIRPGGNVAHPRYPAQPIGDALIVGARTTLAF